MWIVVFVFSVLISLALCVLYLALTAESMEEYELEKEMENGQNRKGYVDNGII